MHTYINDPAYTTSTTEGIQRAGELALARSLNIGRVIAFTGSGMSMEYGRPSWPDFINEYIKLAIDAYEDKVLDDSSIEQVWKEFKSFFKFSSKEKNTLQSNYKKHFIQYKSGHPDTLIEDYLQILEHLITPKTDTINNNLSSFFSKISLNSEITAEEEAYFKSLLIKGKILESIKNDEAFQKNVLLLYKKINPKKCIHLIKKLKKRGLSEDTLNNHEDQLLLKGC